jgi:hypothetical protein
LAKPQEGLRMLRAGMRAFQGFISSLKTSV